MSDTKLRTALRIRLDALLSELGQAMISLGRSTNERAKDKPYWQAKIDALQAEINWIRGIIEK